MNKIKRVSLFFRLVFQFIFIVLPIFLIVSWIYAPNEVNLLMGIIRLDAIPPSYNGTILHTLSPNEKILGCLASAFPTMVNMFIVYCLIKLFKLYEGGDIFSLNHVKYIRNVGYGLLLGQLLEPFYQFMMGLILTMHNPPHHRFATITLDQTNIGILLTALLMILISWIMAEGYKLSEEHQLTV